MEGLGRGILEWALAARNEHAAGMDHLFVRGALLCSTYGSCANTIRHPCRWINCHSISVDCNQCLGRL